MGATGVGVGVGIALMAGTFLMVSYWQTGATQASTGARQAYPAWQSPRLFSFPGDWSNVQPVTVRTIYPAQTSWEWLAAPTHPGSASLLAGTACTVCHGSSIVDAPSVAGWAGPPVDHGESLGCSSCHNVLDQRVQRLGEKLLAGSGLDPVPISGKSPFADVQVKAAFDAEYLYLRLEWQSSRPGLLHDLLRWDGTKWVIGGGPKPEAAQAGRAPSYEDKLAITVGDEDIPIAGGAEVGSSQAGCFGTCHRDISQMPEGPTLDASTCQTCHKDLPTMVEAPPAEGHPADLHVNKYLLIARALSGQPASVKEQEELRRLRQSGQFLDLWVWRAALSAPLGYADDLYILESRFRDEGSAPYRSQMGTLCTMNRRRAFAPSRSVGWRNTSSGHLWSGAATRFARGLTPGSASVTSSPAGCCARRPRARRTCWPTVAGRRGDGRWSYGGS
ncbi:MAG: hypothetical protein HY684_06525 [Chloroflexi bacterium]|nr:hypothetical protein [Chloroflexota bacterium]